MPIKCLLKIVKLAGFFFHIVNYSFCVAMYQRLTLGILMNKNYEIICVHLQFSHCLSLAKQNHSEQVGLEVSNKMYYY